MGDEEATELIFKLEKYGSGWSEELFPRLTVEQRPIKKRIRIRNRSSFPDAWQVREDSLLLFLLSLTLQPPESPPPAFGAACSTPVLLPGVLLPFASCLAAARQP